MQEKILWKTLQDTIQDFHTRVTALTDELGITDIVKGLHIDHAGIRVAKNEDVDTLREELLQHGLCFSSEIVNGREILLFELYTSLQFGHTKIHCIELPYPKPGHTYVDGWEHVEFVIPGEANTLDQMKESFSSLFLSLNIEHIQTNYIYSEDMPESESDQLPNPTIAIRKEKNTCIKFHPKSIQEVVGFIK